MTLDEDIIAFEVWARKLGFSSKQIPTKEALKSVFRSPQGSILFTMMKRIRPRQDVQELRENLLIKRMEKFQGQGIPICSRNSLPLEVQRYLRLDELKSKKKELKRKISEHESQYNNSINVIRTKNMEITQLEHKREILRAKLSMLDVKRKTLRKQEEEETTKRSRIIASMPVKLNSSNVSEPIAAAAVQKAMQELDTFYSLVLNNSNPHIVQDAKDDLWKKMRRHFDNVPNFLIFNTLLKIKEDQTRKVISLNSNPRVTDRKDESFTAFEMKMLKSKSSIIGLATSYMAARRECQSISQAFSEAYVKFVENVQSKINIFNNDDVDDVISQYVVQYATQNFYHSQNDYILSRIEACKEQIEEGNKHLKDHIILLNSVQQVYSDIQSSVNRIQYELMQLNKVKEKILFSANMLQHLVGDVQMELNNFPPSAAKNNFVGLTNYADNSSTLEISGLNVFSSTKLDFEQHPDMNTTVKSVDVGSTMANPQPRCILPPLQTELRTFLDTPFEKFSSMERNCAMYLVPNPLVTESHELLSHVQLVPGINLTPYGCLQKVKTTLDWFDLIAELSSELKINATMIDGVNAAFLQAKKKQQNEELVELLDKIEIADANTHKILKSATRYYYFLLNNPLKNYIPSTKRVNNQTYEDYEAEYKAYYRMITKGHHF